MRIIVKPAGLLAGLGLLAALGVLVFIKTRPSEVNEPNIPNAPITTPEPTNSVSEPTTPVSATPDAPIENTAPAENTAPEGNTTVLGSATQALPPVDWKKSRRILEPDITGNQWNELITKGKLTHKVVPATVEKHPFARQISVVTVGENAWDLQLAHPLDVAFKKGNRLRLTYWGRSKESCQILAVVEEAKAPYTKVVSRTTSLTPEWKEYTEEWMQEADTPSGWAKVNFQVGTKVGTIELTGVAIDVRE
jgi:Carbohydrate binding domain